MVYEFMILDARGSTRLDYVELLPQEHGALVEEAASLGLPGLAQLPSYWGGEERQLAPADVRSLDQELVQVERRARRGTDLEGAAAKLRRLVDVALRTGRPLEIVPD